MSIPCLSFKKQLDHFTFPLALNKGVTFFLAYQSLYFSASVYIGSHFKKCSFDGNSFLVHLTCLCVHSWSYLYIICHQCSIIGRCSLNFFLLFWISEFCGCWGWGLPYILGNDILWDTLCENISSLGKLSFFVQYPLIQKY